MQESDYQSRQRPHKSAGPGLFITELRQRIVFKIAVFYGITGWIIVQAVTAISPAYGDDTADWWQDYATNTRLVTLPDGKQLSLLCMGEGTPVVIMEAGLGFDGMIVMRKVQTAIGQVTRTCSYDRAGIGRSAATDSPRDAGAEADDLAALLKAAELPAPYVVFSGSYGGYIAQLFASRHTRDVAGLVLGDPSSAHQYDRFAVVVPETVQIRESALAEGRECAVEPRPADLVTTCQPSPPADMPPELMAQWLNNHDPAHTSHVVREREAMNALSSDLLDSEKTNWGAIPFVVLNRDPTRLDPTLSAADGMAIERVWLQMHLEIMDQSSDSQLHIVPGAGHPIHIDRPDAVINVVTDMVLKIRGRTK